MAYTDVCGKKLRAKMGAVLNEAATSHSPALLSSDQSFAKRQLEKMGWSEGTGLGKRRDGRKEHVKIKQREDEMGLGREGARAKEMGNVWWKDSVGGTLARLQQLQQQKKKKEKGERADKRRKKEGKKSRCKPSGECGLTTVGLQASTTITTTAIKTFTDDELFKATGGARFGMRAQRRAEGKWKRTESGTELTKLEEKAKAGMEWNGRGNARAVLVEGKCSSKKKKRMREEVVDAIDKAVSPSISERECREDDAEDGTQSKKKRRKLEKLNKSVASEEEEDKESRKKKRKKKEKKEKKEKKNSKKDKSKAEA